MTAKYLKIKRSLLENTDTNQTIVKNTFWLSFSEFVGRALRMTIVIYGARVLGAAGWGTFAYMTSLAAIFTIFSDIGISTVLVREVSKSPDAEKKYFSTTFVIKVALTFVSFIVLVFATPAFTAIEISKILLLCVGFLFIFDSLRRFGTSLFRAREKMEKEALINIVTQATIIVGGFIALMTIKTPESLAAAYAVGAGIGVILAGYFLKDNLRELISGFDKTLVAPIVKAAWPLSLAAIFGMLLVNTDSVLIGWFKSAEYVGYYSAAQKPITLLYILPTLIVGGFFPPLARLAKVDDEAFRKIFEKALTSIMAVAFPISAGIIITSSEIVRFLYGAEYALAGGPLRILGATILTAFPISIIIHGIFAYNRQSSIVPLWVAGAILNVVLNVLLIPNFGISGSAWASLITQFIINGLIWKRFKRINNFTVANRLPTILLATLMMSVVAVIGKLIDLHILLIIPLAAMAYFTSLTVSGDNVFRELKNSLRQT